MKLIYPVIISFLLLVSCSSTQDRKIASTNSKLNGTLLGVALYKKPYTGKNPIRKKFGLGKNRATRIYLSEIQDEPGSFNCIVLEYVDLLKMAPKYVASNKLPRFSKLVGFLNQITKRITTYKVTPTRERGIYEMQKLRVSGDELVASEHEKPSHLILSEPDSKKPLEGARITSAPGGEPVEIYFPKSGTKKSYGVQYALANFTYDKVDLNSTWRKSFLRGPYLGAYADKSDKILELNSNSNGDFAHFIINEERTHLPTAKRERQLTNAKSAYIFGDYSVIEPRDGMFLFKPLESDMPGQKFVEGRIGLFIDIFDASVSLNQDVVELVLIDPNNPTDFLMYYEHPDNGEGK